MDLELLKRKRDLNRADIAALLKSIGKPGEKRDEKKAALEELGKVNRQGHDLAMTVESYMEY